MLTGAWGQGGPARSRGTLPCAEMVAFFPHKGKAREGGIWEEATRNLWKCPVQHLGSMCEVSHVVGLWHGRRV